MEIKKEGTPTRQWIPLIASMLPRSPLVFFFGVLGLAYYLRPAFDYDHFPELLFSGIGPAVLAWVVISVVISKPAADLFYGAELAAEAREKGTGRGLKFPDPSNFYPTMTSDIGTLRKCAGYVYAIAAPATWFATGVLFGAILSGPPSWW